LLSTEAWASGAKSINTSKHARVKGPFVARIDAIKHLRVN
jgi:hypothetical protein